MITDYFYSAIKIIEFSKTTEIIYSIVNGTGDNINTE